MTARSKGPEKATLGVRSHSGWAAYVVLAGNAEAPDILARGRMTLCDPAIPGSKQPFHEAEPMPFAQAQKYIARCTASSAKLATKAIAALGHDISACCVLTASGRPLPDLKGILASHANIHAAEGEFYRDAVAHACAKQNIAVRRVRERDMEAELQTLPISVNAAKAKLAEFGKALGSPWTADEKLSALGAWLLLAALPSRAARR
ncbi:MAG: hypothetical protein JO167_09395 [Alphaproteobacteria bacterium]|nr:hypothetical protein [Alphaproteobacteria bacterium]